MKLIHKIIIIVFLFPSFLGVKAQFGEQVIITDEVNGVRNIVLGDIDNDGLKDILYASQVDNNIGWIKNINNATNFRELNIIGFSNQTLHGSLADLDSDGDLDALAITVAQDKVYWFENTDGLGDFETRQTIAINFDGAFKVEGADINGDGFMDAVASAMNEQSIYWFENLNGTNTFGAKQVIANTNTVGRYFNLVDIDNDGDIDWVSSSGAPQIVSWFENDGLGNFSDPIAIAGSGQAVNSLYSADIDGDGDIDVITPSGGDNQLAWYENLDGEGTFGGKNIISNETIDVRWAYAADLDNDGDMDVLSASSNALVDVSWFENLDGEGTFGAKQIITTDIEGIATVTAADMDNDGAIDVLSTSYNEGKIAWYRNSTILNTDVFLTTSLKVYPNPAKTVLNIQLESGEIDIVVIYNMRGVEVLTKNKNVQQINIENLSNGIYFLKVYSNQKRLR